MQPPRYPLLYLGYFFRDILLVRQELLLIKQTAVFCEYTPSRLHIVPCVSLQVVLPFFYETVDIQFPCRLVVVKTNGVKVAFSISIIRWLYFAFFCRSCSLYIWAEDLPSLVRVFGCVTLISKNTLSIEDQTPRAEMSNRAFSSWLGKYFIFNRNQSGFCSNIMTHFPK